MDNTTTLDLDGLTLEITTMPFEPVTQYRLLAEIGKVLVPTVLAARKATDIVDLGPAVKALFDELTPDFATEAMQHILAGTSVTRRSPDADPERIDLLSIKQINRAFKGAGLKPMMLAIKHALEVNFGRFFDASGAGETDPTPPTPSA